MRFSKLLLILCLCLYKNSIAQTPSVCLDKIQKTILTQTANYVSNADLNNDGNLDLILQAGTNKWLFYKGNGNGTFIKQDSINASSYRPLLSDLNNDGKLDLIGHNWFSLNNGNLNFTPSLSLLPSASGFSDASDLNSDGYNDIVSVKSNSLLLYVNNQAGGFNAPVFLGSTAGGTAKDLKLADFDKDGLTDIIIPSNNIYLHKATAALTFSSAVSVSTLTPLGETMVLDLNNDLFPDLVSLKESNKAVLSFINNAGINYQAKTSSLDKTNANFYSTTYFNPVHLNGDGFIDGFAYNLSNELITVINDQSGGFYIKEMNKGVSSVQGLTAGDFNNDSNPDVITVTNVSTIAVNYFTNYGNLEFHLPKSYAEYNPKCDNPLSDDFDKDGDMDIMHFSKGKPFIIENYAGKDTAYFLSINADTIGGGGFMQKADINSDGLNDVIYFDTNKKLAILINMGGLKFKPAFVYNLLNQIGGIAISDFNNDSKPDIALSHYSANLLTVMVNTSSPGNLSFTNVYTNLSHSSSAFIAAGDYNHDGKSDIALVENMNLRIYSGLGNSTFGLSATYAMPGYVDQVFSYKLNNDAYEDLVLTNSGGIYTYFGTASGNFGSLLGYTVTQPNWIEVADVNKDGNNDIIVSTQSSGFSVLLGQGTNTLTAPQLYYYPENIYGLTVSDRDNNGPPEIIIRTNSGLGIVGNHSPYINISPAYTLCAGQNLSLFANNLGLSSSFNWMPGGITTSSVSISTPGNLYYSLTNILLGCNAMSNTISITSSTASPVSGFAISGAVSPLCAGDSLKLSTNTNYTPHWNTSDTLSNVTYFPNFNTLYIASVIDSNGCTVSDSVYIQVKPNPLTVISTASTTICEGTSITFTASGASTYSWTPGGISNTITVTPSVTTVYSVTGSHLNGCSNTSTLNLTVNPTPPVNIIPSNTLVCTDTYFNLTASGASTYTWVSLPMPYTFSQSINVSLGSNGTFTLKGTSAAGCQGTDTLTIFTIPSPLLSYSISQNPICIGQTATLAVSGANTYTWSAGSNSTSISVSPLSYSTYTVIGEGTNGCVSQATMEVYVYPCNSINESSDNKGLTVSPNPFFSSLKVVYPTNSEYYFIEICDVVGKQLYYEKVFSANHEIDVRDLIPGVYFIRILDKNLVYHTEKIIKQ